ncbi:recombination regulator RecX [Gammaproteobacteria bacterium]|jgi:regulatory protein|nr:recombination regulator RecX [Gammaproteobacteria bacterium]
MTISANDPDVIWLVKLLARREYSAFEIAERLSNRGVDSDRIELIIAFCQAKGWQSDQRFAEQLTLYRLRLGYGIYWLRSCFQQHNIPQALVDLVLGQVDASRWQSALAVAKKKYHRMHATIDQNKYILFLNRRGFTHQDGKDNV